MSDIPVMPTTANQVFAAFSFLGCVVSLIPLPWHLQGMSSSFSEKVQQVADKLKIAWNTGTCLYMLWASVGCFNYFINAVVWNSTVANVAPAWCEISIRIILACNIGVPAASLCITRRLYRIATMKSARITSGEKRR